MSNGSNDQPRNIKDKLKKTFSIAKTARKIYTNSTGKTFRIETARIIYLEQKYREKLKIMEMIIGVVSLISILNSIVHYELTYDNSINETNSTTNNNNSAEQDKLNKYHVFLYTSSILTLILLLSIFFSEKLKLELQTKIGKLNQNENLISSGKYLNLIYYFIIVILHPNPIFDEKTFSSYNHIVKKEVIRPLNSLFTVFIMTRSFFIIKLFLFNSKYMDPESNRICNMYNFDADEFFSLKSTVKESPLNIYFVGLITSVLVFSYSIRIFERPISHLSGQNFNNIWNPIWYVVITMTTVGYGDYAAKTNEGRILVMLSSALGVFLISMMVVSITNILTFELNEINAFIIMRNAESEESKKEAAKKVVYKFTSIASKHSFRQIYNTNPELIKGLLKSIGILKNLSPSFENETGDFQAFDKILNFLDSKQTQIYTVKNNQEIQIKEIKRRVADLIRIIQKKKNSIDE